LAALNVIEDAMTGVGVTGAIERHGAKQEEIRSTGSLPIQIYTYQSTITHTTPQKKLFS
jgi:hypothetical protein